MQSKIQYMSVLVNLPVQDLEYMFGLQPEAIMAGTTKVHTRKEWSVILKQLGIDFD